MENKSERFKRLATQRTIGVMEKIRILGNLSNKSYYHYSDEEISKIFSAIELQLRTTKSLFQTKKVKEFNL